jgi:hypothetical protein
MVVPHLRQRILARRLMTLSSAIEYLAAQEGHAIFTMGPLFVFALPGERRVFGWALGDGCGRVGSGELAGRRVGSLRRRLAFHGATPNNGTEIVTIARFTG